MSNEGRFIGTFAAIGLSVGIVTALCHWLHAPDYLKNLLILTTPTMTLFQQSAWSSVRATWAMSAFVAFSNAWVYTIVAAILSAVRPRRTVYGSRQTS